MPEYLDDLRLAHVLADAADAVTIERFKALDLKVETKPDMTPVTDADKATEELIRTSLSRSRPRDAVVGEEFGSTGHGPRRWVVDPIDGTKNYVRGVPVWATLIALLDRCDDGVERPVVGLVSAPALQRRWWASRGTGAFTGRSLSKSSRIAVSNVAELGDASLGFSDLAEWEDAGKLQNMLALQRAVWRSRGYGDFWPYMMVAEGAVDLCSEPELNLWDMAPLAVIVEEAGGRFTSLDGRDGVHGGNAAASNGRLHEAMLGYLG